MSYTLSLTNGRTLTLLNDGLVDTAVSSLNLIGKNVTNFGDAQNENFLHLLENFAYTGEPNSPLTGQLWFSTTESILRPVVFDGAAWRPLAVSLYSNTTTDTLINAGGANFTASVPGDFWFNSVDRQLHVITGTNYETTLIGPELVRGYSTTKMTSTKMIDTRGVGYPVIQMIVNGEVIGIVSTATFTANTVTAVTGIQPVNRGITLKNSSSTITASVIAADEMYDTGARVITTATLPPTIVIGDTAPSNSAFGSSIKPGALWWDSSYNNLRIYYNDGDSSQWVDAVSTIVGPIGPPGPQGVPGPVGGAPSQVLYNRSGTTSGSSNLTFDDTNLTAAAIITTSISAGAPSTVGAITGNWSLTSGSRLQSTYADLAEYYSADAEYSPGTVLVFGGSAEVTTTDSINDVRLAGVVTTNPSYIMNQDQVGLRACVALQGRVPVKVLGTVSKGDMLTTSDIAGCAVRATAPQLGAII
jgi:hypothetical protein